MANIIPSLETKLPFNRGEEFILNEISNSLECSDWTIFRSLKIRRSRNPNAVSNSKIQEGEIDFLIIIPNLGIVILEIKSHPNLKIKNNEWFNARGDLLDPQPMVQVERQKENLNKYLDSDEPTLGIKWSDIATIVCTPFSEISLASNTIEFNEFEIIDESKIDDQGLIHHIKRGIKESKTRNWSATNIETIKNSLTSRSDVPSSKRFEYLKKKLNQLDDFQKGIVTAIEFKNRIYFEGLPGTGKTDILKYCALKASEENKVLLTCYNKNLSSKLLKDYEDISSENLTVIHIHELMTNILKKGGKWGEAENIRKEKGPDYFFLTEIYDMTLNLLSLNSELKEHYSFDQIFIDEGQDILGEENNRLFIDEILKGGFKEGNWMIAADYEMQDIYRGGNQESTLNYLENITGQNLSESRLQLKTNYRNTKEIGNSIFNFSNNKDNYKSYNRKNEFDPRYILCNSEEDEIKELDNLLKELTLGANKVNPEDIVILSSRRISENHPLFKLDNRIELKKIDPDYFKDKPNKIGYGTIQSFKGLESYVVILININKDKVLDEKRDYDNKVFRTGGFRSLYGLYVLFSEN